jgi:hypothetical protein
VEQSNGFIFTNLSVFGMMPTILPASDIIDGAKQALEAKSPAPEEKPVTEEKTEPPATKSK